MEQPNSRRLSLHSQSLATVKERQIRFCANIHCFAAI